MPERPIAIVAPVAPIAIVAPDLDGERLDASLRRLFPDLSVRAARRILRERAIFRNNRPISPRGLLRAGDCIRIAEPEDTPASLLADVRVLCVQGEFAALAKPSGLHSESLHGGREPGLEDALPALLAGFPGDWRLLNRLDKATSGIVLAGASEEAGRRFRDAENTGQAKKIYYAVVHGEFAHGMPIVVSATLDTANTSRSKALDSPDPDPVRHTLVEPLAALLPEQLALFTEQELSTPISLLRCTIHKGRRHQIRAHLAHIGHAIVGDAVYGDALEGAPLFLHHAMLLLPDFEAECPVEWAEVE